MTQFEKAASPMPRRVLLVSHDIAGPLMAGPGIRYVHLARVLANHAEVTLAIPHESPGKPAGEPFRIERYDRAAWPSLAPHVEACDICVFPSDIAGTFPQLAQSAAYLVVDGYDPLLAEWLAIHGRGDPDALAADWRDRLAQLQRQYTLGDFYICASERQRDWWLGLLEANGRVNPAAYAADPSLRMLIDVVPYGLPDAPPQHTQPVVKGVWPGIGPHDKLLLWGGGLWSWLDPVTAIEAVRRVAAQRPDVRLIFPGTRHPNPELRNLPGQLRNARAAAQEAGLLDTVVFFGDWIPYADWANLLLECDVALSLHFDTLETRLAFRSRVLEYIWAGLPIVATEGDAAAEMVARYALGRVVRYNDAGDAAEAILALLDAKQDDRPGFAAAVEELNWTRAAAPLIAYCRSPWRAADKGASNVYSPSLMAQLEQERAHYEALIRGYESGRFMRLMRWIERRRRRFRRSPKS
ncbi:MAG: glycosyltransferase [Chloroflexota bacterium]|nr:glycosyltransferase [Chloroflexota bacterium]